MGDSEYEPKKSYLIRGFTVTSEIVRDQTDAGVGQRSLFIKSSCESQRWGIRTHEHSFGCPIEYPQFSGSFENVRRQAAETLVAQELGEAPVTGFHGMAIDFVDPQGKSWRHLCAPTLEFPHCAMSPAAIEAMKLRESGLYHIQIVDGAVVQVPLFTVIAKFGEYSVETTVLPSEHNGCTVIGGHFFQAALANNPQRICELLVPEHSIALANAARCKKRYVLISGKYGTHRARLERIKQALGSHGFRGLILDEYPDIEEQTLAEKFVTFGSIARFVIVDDVAPSGHIDELKTCHELKFVTAVLRDKGRPATAMQSTLADEVEFIKVISYDGDSDLQNAVRQGATWADDVIHKRSARLNRLFSDWRSPTKIMR